MYLALVRDAVIFGDSWGRSGADQAQDLSDLQSSIEEFSAYVLEVHQKGRHDFTERVIPFYRNVDLFKMFARNAGSSSTELLALFAPEYP